MRDVSSKYRILNFTIREHYVGKTKSRDLGPHAILTMVKEEKLVQYLEEMVRVSCPLKNPTKVKVTKITQTRMTPFINGISCRF